MGAFGDDGPVSSPEDFRFEFLVVLLVVVVCVKSSYGSSAIENSPSLLAVPNISRAATVETDRFVVLSSPDVVFPSDVSRFFSTKDFGIIWLTVRNNFFSRGRRCSYWS